MDLMISQVDWGPSGWYEVASVVVSLVLWGILVAGIVFLVRRVRSQASRHDVAAMRSSLEGLHQRMEQITHDVEAIRSALDQHGSDRDGGK